MEKNSWTSQGRLEVSGGPIRAGEEGGGISVNCHFKQRYSLGSCQRGIRGEGCGVMRGNGGGSRPGLLKRGCTAAAKMEDGGCAPSIHILDGG